MKKNIIITGATGGLGKEIVKIVLKNFDVDIISISRAKEYENDFLNANERKRIKHFMYDLSNPAGIKELYLNQIKPSGEIIGLVNNSAFAYDDIATNANEAILEKMFAINVFSPIQLTKYAIRDMLLHNNKGAIVHISSISAHTGYKGLSLYAATKGALEAFSKNIAREWGRKGIRSNCVVPGFMETNMSSSLGEDMKDKIYRRTSLGQPTDAHSVAETVGFLLSDKAASVTGATIRVDNGTI